MSSSNTTTESFKCSRRDTDTCSSEPDVKRLRASLEDALPPGLKYIANAISTQEEAELLAYIENQQWDTRIKRRVQHYGYEYPYKIAVTQKSQMETTTPIPDLFRNVLYIKLAEHNLLSTDDEHKEEMLYPDQAIVNEYKPGQGIGAHSDNKLVFGERISSFTLGSGCEMIFRDTKSNAVYRLYLEPRSLLALFGKARYTWTHEIRAVKRDTIVQTNGETRTTPRGVRVSITLRQTME